MLDVRDVPGVHAGRLTRCFAVSPEDHRHDANTPEAGAELKARSPAGWLPSSGPTATFGRSLCAVAWAIARCVVRRTSRTRDGRVTQRYRQAARARHPSSEALRRATAAARPRPAAKPNRKISNTGLTRPPEHACGAVRDPRCWIMIHGSILRSGHGGVWRSSAYV